MKIALLGYGRMGKEIEQVALDRGHEIVLRVNDRKDKYDLQKADVAIEFSIPEAAVQNITDCFRSGVPVVCGTTGWLSQYQEILNLCKETDGGFLYASNFSLGVNIFFEMNRKLAAIMKGFDNYKIEIEEIHHIHKKDAPSGTAITLADDIILKSNYEGWEKETASTDKNIPINSKREDEVPGTHIVNYSSEEDKISLYHEAFGRKGFALGAVLAAEFLRGKTGIYSMKEVLNIG